MGDAKVKVYGAPWCPDCRRSKAFLGEMRVPYEWIDVDDNQEAQDYITELNADKRIIPTIVFEDGSFVSEPTNAQLAQKLGIEPKAKKSYYDLIIIGAGPAGLAASVYTSREGLDTLIIDQNAIGGQAGTTERIENYPGFPDGVGGDELANLLRTHAERFGVEILPAQTVTEIEASGVYRLVRTENGDEYGAKSIILGTGTKYRRLGIPGEDELIGAGIHFCATCDGPFYQGQEVVVVGGGNSGLEEGLFLTKFATKVTILEAGEQLRATRLLQDKAYGKAPMVEIRTSHTVEAFEGNGKLKSITVKNLGTGRTEVMHPGGVFIFIGLSPNSEFVKDVVDVDERGFIKTSPTMETNIPGVFAAGDVRAGSTKQVASAVGEGASVALMVRQYLETTEGSRAYDGS